MCMQHLRSKLLFLISVAILAVGLLAESDCLAAEEESGGQKLKEEMRMPWSGQAEIFLREWLICGVFPSPSRDGTEHPRQGYDIDFLQSTVGEAAAQPAAGQTVKRSDGSLATWTQYTSDTDIVNLLNAFSDQQNTEVVAYAYTSINRSESGGAILALGSDDSVKVWLNGELVHSNAVGRAVLKDEDVFPVTFRKGDNSLLIKVENGTGDWGFVLRVLSEAQALALQAGEIQPRIDAPKEGSPNLLTISTDAALGKAIPEEVRIEAAAPGGKIVAEAKAKRGESVDFDTSGWPDGPYEIRVIKSIPEGYQVFRHLPWYKGDWMKQVKELIGECEKLPENPEDPSDLRCRVIRDLVLSQLGDDLSADFQPDQWRSIHSPLMEHRELQMGDSACIRPNGFIRLAWVDEIDNSPQFTRAYLPPDYSPEEKWPMVIILHGYNSSNPEYVNWWSVTTRHHDIAERHNVIVIEPHGRGNTGYSGIGDADVLTAIRVAREKFNVDRSRIYLMGHSMGGGGTWHVGTRHPELFAAIGPIFGGWDYHVDMAEEELAKLTPRQKFSHESESSFAQADALLNTPVFVNHGDSDDLVDVNYSRHIVRMMQKWGYNIRYWEHPGKGHGGLGCEDELVRWFLTHRLDQNPRHVRVRSASLESASAHWVQVEQSEDPFAFILVDAEVTNEHTIRINTENVLQVQLTPGRKLIDRSSPVRITWNGEDVGTHSFSSSAITLQADGYNLEKVHKTPYVSGPIGDVMTTPFAIVVGTISQDPIMKRFCQLHAEVLRDEWKTWQHIEPRYFLDTEITDDQIREYSLLLFGGPDENLVTRKLIDSIPLKIEPGKITLCDQSFDAGDVSISMVYPHPLNPRRYVAIAAGNSSAGMFFADRLPDDMDFAAVEPRVFDDDVPFEKRAIVAGRFDHNWQYDEKFASHGDPSTLAKAPMRKVPKHLSAVTAEGRLMLSELLETRASGSFNYMERDLNWSGMPLKLGGKTYDSGIGVEVWHEPCFATYDLTSAGWKKLRATIGIEVDKKPEEIEQKEKDGTRVYFVVRGDGQELYRSPTFRWDSKPVEMDVDISGVKILELEVANEATWHNIASSVNWADIQLEKK